MEQTPTGKRFAEFIQEEIGEAIADAKKFPNKIIPTNAIEFVTELGNIADKTGHFHLSDARDAAKKHGATGEQMIALVSRLSGGPVEMKLFKAGVELPKSAFADGLRAISEGREDDTKGIEVRWCSTKPVSLSGPSAGAGISQIRQHQK